MKSFRYIQTLFFLLISTLFFSQTSVTFNYTGSVQTWTVPPCVYNITVVAAGAKGGGSVGGNGARITATIAVTPGQILNIYVGGMGSCGSNSGGWNGGGTGHASNNGNSTYNSCGGGGATDLRIGGTALANRVIVAGGGGGKGGGSNTNTPGGTGNCNNGGAGGNTYGAGGGGGTQFAGGNGGAPWAGTPPGGQAGSLGQGGQGGYWQTASGGGGGGGYYGGGGGGNDGCCTGGNGGGGGGAGSSLVPVGGSCLAGNNNGHGYLTITYVGGAPVVSASNNGPLCPGQTLQLSTTATGTYQWSGPNFSSTLQNPTISNVSAANAGLYTLVVNAGGCTSQATTNVIISPTPQINVTTTTICQGQTGTLQASVTPQTPGQFTWTGGSVGSTLTQSPQTTTTYNVTFVPLSGCQATGSGTINVNPTPIITTSGQTICPGQSATLSASSNTLGGTFTWSPGNQTGSTLTVSPNQTTTWQVSYTSAAGCQAQVAQVSAIVNPTPQVSVSNTTICSGQTATLTATSNIAGGTYLWNNGQSGQSISVNPTQTTQYSVVYTAPSGCQSQSVTGIVTVNPTPQITSTNQTICSGQTATLTATTNVPGGTFVWNPGGLQGSSINVNPNQTTQYSVTYTSPNGCVSNQSQSVVTVNPIAIVSVIDDTICSGQSTQLTANTNLAGGTFLWGGGQTTQTISVSPNQTTQYTVVYTSASGCVSSQASATITVNPTPIVTVSNDTICQGQTGQLVAQSSVVGGSWSWNPGGFTQATIQDSPAQTTTYNVIFTTNQGCSSNNQSGTIVVNSNPVITISGTQICLGQTATLNATSSIPGGTFTWNPGNITGSNLSVNPNTTTTYTIDYTAQTGCQAIQQSVTVTVNPIPVVTIPNDTICVGQSGTLTAVVNIPGGTYLWSPGGQTTQSITQSPQTTTTYSVIYTTTSGCQSLSQSAQIIVNPLPVISVTSTSICVGQTATITSTTTIPGGTYSWNSGQTTSTISVSPQTTTQYTLVYTAPTGCQSQSVSGTVNVNPVPSVSILNDTICNGQTGTLIATPSFGGGTFIWSPGNQSGSTLSSSPNQNQIWSVVYTSSSGCQSQPSSGTIVVNPIPQLIVNNSTPSICSGDQVNITLSSSVQNSTISWTSTSNGVTGNSQSNGSQINDVLLTTGQQDGNVQWTIIATANGCSSTQSTTNVIVHPIPNVVILNDTICQGQQATLLATPDVLGGNFIWSSGQTTNSISVSPNTTSTYNVLYDYFGCLNTSSGQVVVNPIPQVSVNSGTICFGDQFTITAQPDLNGGIYTWNPGGVGSNTLTITPQSTTSVSVLYTLNGCQSQLSTSNIVVNPIPIVSLDDTTICQGQLATMTAVPNQLGGTYLWNGTTNGPQTFQTTPQITTPVSVTYTLNGCESVPVTSNIIVNPIPQSILLTPQITGCVPLSWTLVADTTLQHTQFSWQVAGVQYSGDSISGVSYSGNCQDVTLTNTLNGCSQSTTYLNHICSENLPIAEFDASISYFSEATQEVSFNNLSVGFQNSVWNFGDGSQSLQENPNHQFVGNSAGWNISLLVSSQLGCQDTTSLFIPFQESLIFYIPNTFTPDGDKFNNTFKPVFTTGYDPYSYNMKIYNRWGEIIFETFNTQYGWDGYYGQDPLVCQSGVYTYFITFKLPGSEDWRQISGHVNLLR